METVNNRRLRERYIAERHIMDCFGSCRPEFLLMHYAPGELLTNPFSPSRYLQFIVEGDLLLYDMPDEESTVMLQTTYNEVSFLGDVEFLDAQFTPFFVEARTDVYTLALHLSQYREVLQKDPVFLLYLCRTLANKLNGAVIATAHHMSLKKRVMLSLRYAKDGQTITKIGHLAQNLNVSRRQLMRVLKELCEEGVLEHREKGVYQILKIPAAQNANQSSAGGN